MLCAMNIHRLGGLNFKRGLISQWLKNDTIMFFLPNLNIQVNVEVKKTYGILIHDENGWRSLEYI